MIADEPKDVSKKEQISVIVCYNYNRVIKENFLNFICAERLDAAGPTARIVHLLEHHSHDYKKHLIGQTYGSSTVMNVNT